MKRICSSVPSFFDAILTLVLLFPGSPARAEEGAARPVLVTDPVLLRKFGVSKAGKVYAMSGFLNQRGTGTAFGSPDANYSTRRGNEFQESGWFGPHVYGTFYGRGDIFLRSGSVSWWSDGQIDIADGARLESVRWWGHDAHPTRNLEFFVIKSCLPDSTPGYPDVTILASQMSAGSSGDQINEMDVRETVDTKLCTYWTRVRFDATGTLLRLYKVRAQWKPAAALK
jgi:hypothetical protein